MNSLAKDLAEGIDVRTDHRVFSTTWDRGKWSVTCDDAQTVTASTLVLTAPIPQSFSFVFETVETLPRELWSADHDRTIALLAALDGPSALTGSGARHEPSDDIAFVVDHAVKGISPIPAITMNTSPEWSDLFWDAPNDEIEAALSELISPFLGSAHVVEQQVKKWRFALLGQPGRRRAGQITTSACRRRRRIRWPSGRGGISFGCCCRRDNYWVVHTTSVSSPSSKDHQLTKSVPTSVLISVNDVFRGHRRMNAGA